MTGQIIPIDGGVTADSPGVTVAAVAQVASIRGSGCGLVDLLAQVAGDEQLAVGAELLDRPVEHDLPVREHVAAVGDLEGELDVLLDEEHAASGLLGVLADPRQQALDDHRSEAEAELVEEQQPGLAGERAGDGEHLLLPARQQPGAPRPDVRERREVPVRDLGVEALSPVAEPEVLGHGQAEEEPATFRHVGDPEAGAAARRTAGEVVAVEQDAPAHRVDDPGDRPQGRRLARAVGAEEGDDLARTDGQVEVAYHRRLVVAAREAVDLEDQVAHVTASVPATSDAALPRYAAITCGSRRTSSGVPAAITFPNSSATTWSEMPSTSPMS